MGRKGGEIDGELGMRDKQDIRNLLKLILNARVSNHDVIELSFCINC